MDDAHRLLVVVATTTRARATSSVNSEDLEPVQPVEGPLRRDHGVEWQLEA